MFKPGDIVKYIEGHKEELGSLWKVIGTSKDEEGITYVKVVCIKPSGLPRSDYNVGIVKEFFQRRLELSLTKKSPLPAWF